MVIKRKDFQKAAAFIHEFLLKLSEDVECAEVRDTLNLALLHMQKYYRLIQSRSQEKNGHLALSLTARGLSPMTPFVDAPDKFIWRWVNLDNTRNITNMSLVDSVHFVVLPPLIDAARNGDVGLISEILQEDPSCVDCTDGFGRTAVMYAVHFFRHDALQFLLEHRADVNAQAHDESTAVHRACHDANHIALKMLIDHDGNFTVCDVHGRAPIHWAVTTRSTECLQILLAHGASVGTRDKDMLTPLMWACRMDNIQHFELLCQADNKVEEHDGIERDANGRTWMHWSVRRSQPLECLQTLLTLDSAAIKDKEGKTVLLVAAEMGSLHACRVILEIAGERCIQDQDNQGRTALHVATMGGHGDVVNFLLEKNADVNVVDSYNATAWDYARIRKLHYCQLIIMSHQRQRMANNPMSPLPNGLGLLMRADSGVHDDFSKMSFRTRSSQSTPVTPPHPPKRPRSSRILVRRANSLTSADRETAQQQQHEATNGSEEKLFTTGGQRERVLVSVNASNKRSSVGDVFLNRREDTVVTDSSRPVFEDENDEISVEGMDVSDIEDETVQPSAQASRGPTQMTLRPRPPPRKRPDDLMTSPPPLGSMQNRGDRGDHVLSNRNNNSMHLSPQKLKQHLAQQIEFEDMVSGFDQKGRGGSTLARPQARVPPTPIFKPSRGGPIPTPPSATPQRPHMIRHQQPLPSSIPRGTQPLQQQSHDRLSPSSRESPSLSSQSSDLQQHSSRSPGDRPSSGSNQPPGVLEGFRIPPPALSPLQNAPKPPDLDMFDRKIKKKRKKEKKEGNLSPQKPENPSDIPPPFGLAAPLHPHIRNQGGQVIQVNHATVPFPKYAKGPPKMSESRYVDENLEDNEKPPIVKGIAVQIREGISKSAKPINRNDVNAVAKTRNEDMPEEAGSDDQEESIIHSSSTTVEDANTGPFIPPPPSFRGVPRSGTVRPLGQSVPQDSKSSRMIQTSAKPPLPNNRLSAKSSSPRPPARNVATGHKLSSHTN
ncbi:hypothetical protein BsWGS_21836 [Bradybaena similaris]